MMAAASGPEIIEVLKKISISIIRVYVIVLVILFIFQRYIIFLPEKIDKDYKFDFNIPYEEINIEYNKKNDFVNALIFKSLLKKSTESRQLILYYHGNAGSLRSWGYIAQDFTRLGYDVLIFDYPGYGKSSGSITPGSLLEASGKIYEYAAGLYGYENIVVYGRSIGTSFAAYSASLHNPRMLILESALYSTKELAAYHFPWVPGFLLRFKYDTGSYVKKIKSRIILFHGTSDRTVPYEHSQRLSGIAENSKVFLIENGGHNNLDQFPDYYRNLESVLKK